ncbi:MAG: adenylate/guanylate cyclase domain-containing protein [Amaricoccus sp.]
MRFPLRAKFFVFAALLATAPLAIVGQNLARIARDELKSAANEDLTGVAASLASDFDTTVRGRWITPLLVIRNGVDSEDLGVQQKVSLLTLGLSQIPDIVALQLSVEGSDLPILVTGQDFSRRISDAGLDPVQTLRAPADTVAAIRDSGHYGTLVPRRIPETGDWLATVAFPLHTQIAGRTVTLSAQVNLAPLGDLVARNPFARRGEINVVDADGDTVLDRNPHSLADRAIIAAATPLIVTSARPEAIEGYVRKDGKAMLGAYAFPDAFPWAIVAELSEASAYAVVNHMLRNLWLVGAVGFGVAAAAALLFAGRLTGPILKIGQVAARVGAGDLSARVEGVRTRDEIGDLAGRMNAMIRQLSERLELMKFVSRGTASAVAAADSAGVARGGARRRIAALFSDIRGYTAFSEANPPEVVVEMLNSYLDLQTEIIERNGGDVDKFIGDEVVAVFQGEGMERNAVRSGLEIQRALADMLEAHPEWNLHVGVGISAGEVVMGAIGARERLDFTVLGGTVNLAARLCAVAPPDAVIISAAVREALAGDAFARFVALPPVELKGMPAPVPVFAVQAAEAAERVA